nr:hypothetical protein [Alicyclobacillus montanus]
MIRFMVAVNLPEENTLVSTPVKATSFLLIKPVYLSDFGNDRCRDFSAYTGDGLDNLILFNFHRESIYLVLRVDRCSWY